MSGQVWVVDDVEPVAESVTTLLVTEGIPARALTTVAGTWAALNEGEPPALMLLDLGLAGNGRGLLASIAAEPGWTFPILVLSGQPAALDSRVAGRVNAVLCKPVEPVELVRAVRHALETHVGGGAL